MSKISAYINFKNNQCAEAMTFLPKCIRRRAKPDAGKRFANER
jgi:hypothetical protein